MGSKPFSLPKEAGLSCPDGGDFYACNSLENVSFFGCCMADPCPENHCPPNDIRPASFNATFEPIDISQLDCPSTGPWVCRDMSPPFVGCCGLDPHKMNGCAELFLEEAFLNDTLWLVNTAALSSSAGRVTSFPTRTSSVGSVSSLGSLAITNSVSTTTTTIASSISTTTSSIQTSTVDVSAPVHIHTTITIANSSSPSPAILPLRQSPHLPAGTIAGAAAGGGVFFFAMLALVVLLCTRKGKHYSAVMSNKISGQNEKARPSSGIVYQPGIANGMPSRAPVSELQWDPKPPEYARVATIYTSNDRLSASPNISDPTTTSGASDQRWSEAPSRVSELEAFEPAGVFTTGGRHVVGRGGSYPGAQRYQPYRPQA